MLPPLAGARTGWFVAVHLALSALLAAQVRWLRAERPRRVARAAFALVGLPVVFSAMGLVLPWWNPEPWEWAFVDLDRALLGTDPTVAAQAWLGPWSVELLQWAYATFYLVPIAAVIAVGRRGGARAFDAALATVVFGFLLSYLGYALWPTLPPYRCLAHEAPLHGALFAATLNGWLYAAEANRWDCFPSGHTMLSVLAWWLAWRHARPASWLLAPWAALVVVSTVALRYHFAVDVLAGFAGAALAGWLARFVADPA